MVSYADYVAGWLDASVCDSLEAFTRNSKTMNYALLTCLDSCTKPASLLETSPVLRALEAEILGHGLLLPTRNLLEGERYRQVFFGFDEAWFFPEKPRTAKPDSVWLVGPARISQDKLSRLGEWMAESGCALALADGDGLNFVVKARGLVKHVIAQTLAQPQHTAFVAQPVT